MRRACARGGSDDTSSAKGLAWADARYLVDRFRLATGLLPKRTLEADLRVPDSARSFFTTLVGLIPWRDPA